MEHEPSQLQSVEEGAERRPDAEVSREMGNTALREAAIEQAISEKEALYPDLYPELPDTPLYRKARIAREEYEQELHHDLMVRMQMLQTG